MSSIFNIGQQVRITGTFKDSSGTLTNPTSVSFSYKEGGTTTTYVYGTDAELVRDSTGVYHVDITPAAAGRIEWRLWSTGNLVQAEQGSFYIRPTNV